MAGDVKSDRWRARPWFLLRGTGLPFAWLEALGERLAWTIEDERAWAAAVERARAGLRALVHRPLFEEAVFMSGGELGRGGWRGWLDRPERNSKARGRERTLLRYAQRLCAKNDSTSFFGAVGAGRFDLVESADRERPICATRRVFITQWVAQQLLAQAGDALRASDGFIEHPGRAPGAAADDADLFSLRVEARGGLSVEAAATGRSAALGADGETSLAELAARLAWPVDDVEALLDAGLLTSWTELPTGLEDPVAEALARLRRQPTGSVRDLWLSRFEALERRRADFEAAAYPARRPLLEGLEAFVAELTGEAPRRKAGEFYASRTMIFESCARTAEPIGLPAGWAGAIEESVAAWLEVCLLPAALERARFRAWFDHHAGGDAGRIPWREVVATLKRDPISFEGARSPEVDALRAAEQALRTSIRAAVDAHVAAQGPDVPCALPPSLARDALAPVAALLEEPGAAFANPDIMLVWAHGVLTPVLAEAHHLPYLTPYLTPALPQRDQIVADTSAHLAALCAPALPAFVCAYQHSFISVTDDFGAVALELSGSAPVQRGRRASFAELGVRRTRRGFDFEVPSYEGATLRVVPLARVTRLDRAAAAFPVSGIDLGAWLPDPRAPRILWGDLVVQRRRWIVRSDAWAARAPYEAAARLRDLCGEHFPRWTFVITGAEPKPVLIDWANPLSVELAQWMAARSNSLTFGEMLPGPGQLWLTGPDGLHTSELRTLFVRR